MQKYRVEIPTLYFVIPRFDCSIFCGSLFLRRFFRLRQNYAVTSRRYGPRATAPLPTVVSLDKDRRSPYKAAWVTDNHGTP